MAFYFQLNSWKQGTSERGPVNWPIYQFLDGRWTTPCRTRKCIPRGYTAKGNCFLGRTKLSLGQLFPFLDHQLCLASLRSADNLLMIAESEKLSLGKFCSSSKTFLSSIPCRNIYSFWWYLLRYYQLECRNWNSNFQKHFASVHITMKTFDHKLVWDAKQPKQCNNFTAC